LHPGKTGEQEKKPPVTNRPEGHCKFRQRRENPREHWGKTITSGRLQSKLSHFRDLSSKRKSRGEKERKGGDVIIMKKGEQETYKGHSIDENQMGGEGKSGKKK